MRRFRPLVLSLLAVWAVTISPAYAEKKEEARWSWYEVDKDKNVQVNLHFFWLRGCPHCARAQDFLKDLKKRHDWLIVHSYEIGNADNLNLYRKMAASLKGAGGQVPAFFYCKQMVIGLDGNTKRIEKGLTRCREALQKKQQEAEEKEGKPIGRLEWKLPLLPVALIGIEQPTAEEEEMPDLPIDVPADESDSAVNVPLWGDVEAGEVSLPLLTLVIAGCDAFNPCAFFVLLFLLSLLIHSRSRLRMLVVGGTFVFFSGLMYFLFMAAWLNLFILVGHLRIITVAAGIVAVVAALVNIKDFFWFQRGLSLSIPATAKPGLYQRMTRLIRTNRLMPLLAGSAALACAANLYELLCTSGFPLIYTRVLTLRELPLSTYYLYLALYNLIYVTPLAVIVGVFTFTLGSRKLTEHEGRVLKLLSGLMMLLLGMVLLIAPALLDSVAGAVGILVGAVGLTAMAVLFDKFLRGTHASGTRSTLEEKALSP